MGGAQGMPKAEKWFHEVSLAAQRLTSTKQSMCWLSTECQGSVTRCKYHKNRLFGINTAFLQATFAMGIADRNQTNKRERKQTC
jgi:hypothetical protein